MLRACVLDFQGNWVTHLPLAEFAYNNSYQASIGMAPFEALYGRPCRSPICWVEVGYNLLTGPTIVAETTENIKIIKERLRTAQGRQKSYADHRRRLLRFEVGQNMLLRVSPKKGITRFGLKGKLSPRFIGPFQIVDKIGKVAYKLALPTSLGQVHDVFHVSMLRGYESDSSHVIEWKSLQLKNDISYQEGAIEILDHKEKVLRNKVIPLVKVRWIHHNTEEATWEKESDMRAQHPEPFS